jgi:hypothetical protein
MTPCGEGTQYKITFQYSVYMIKLAISDAYSCKQWKELPVPVAERSEAHTVFVHSNTGTVGSNHARGIDVCPRFSVLRCPV